MSGTSTRRVRNHAGWDRQVVKAFTFSHVRSAGSNGMPVTHACHTGVHDGVTLCSRKVVSKDTATSIRTGFMPTCSNCRRSLTVLFRGYRKL